MEKAVSSITAQTFTQSFSLRQHGTCSWMWQKGFLCVPGSMALVRTMVAAVLSTTAFANFNREKVLNVIRNLVLTLPTL